MTKSTPTPLLIANGSPIKGYTEVYSLSGQAEETIAEIKTEYVEDMVNAMNCHVEAIEVLRACLDRLTELGYSIHEAGLLQTISKLLSKMEG